MSVTERGTEPTGADGPGREHGTYAMPNDWKDARRRLRGLERCYDSATIRRLEATGVGPGWRCLEVGAGGGSITRWLCRRVGPTGSVVAVDMNTCFLDELDEENLEVRCQDVVDQPVPAAGFDLVHTRALLMHLPARDAVLADLIAAVRPGGWLVVEEADFLSIIGAGSGVYREMFTWAARALAPIGMESEWARRLPNLFASAGLQNITADMEAPFFPGGSSAGAEFMAVTFMQLRSTMLAAGCPEKDLDACLAGLADPSQWFPNLAMIGTSGRRPG